MEFLTYVRSRWPADGDPQLREQLMKAEHARVLDLRDAGALARMWRDPGCWATWMLWTVPGPDELHAAVTSLPMFPWLEVTVHPLGSHPADAAQWPA